MENRSSTGKPLERRGSVVRKVWLNYYNNYLYEHNVITETEKRKMQRLIEKRDSGMER